MDSPASILSELVRAGGLNEVLTHLNRLLDEDGGAGPAAASGAVGAAGRAAIAESLAGIHAALGRPDRKLVAYGTLVPGGRNHSRVSALRGAWATCFVRGRRWTAQDGDPGFLWNPADPEVDAMLLVSEDLPAAWPELDRFEGIPYRRHLVPVRTPDAWHVAYLYDRVE